MAGPVRAGRWVTIVTVVAALLVAGWTLVSWMLASLLQWGADGVVQLVLIFLFLVSANSVKQGSRRSGGGARDEFPHD